MHSLPGAIMRRRDLVGVGSAMALWPHFAVAQPSKVWRMAILDTATRELNSRNLEAFYRRLSELGYVEGSNLIIHYRSVDGRNERLPSVVSEIIRFNPDVIVVRGSPEIVAVKSATTKIPVVMSAVA